MVNPGGEDRIESIIDRLLGLPTSLRRTTELVQLCT
jgi:hypothetical protein